MSRHLDELHADWLSLVEPEGQFLTLPVLKHAFPNGLANVPATVRVDLRKHYPRDVKPTAEQWNVWIDWLLRDVLAWGPCYQTGSAVAAYILNVPEHGTNLRAHGALCDPQTGKPRVLVMTFPHGTTLNKRQPGERWNASPIERLKELCKAHDVRVGMVTDGERIVVAWVPDIAGGYATWPTPLFLESRERGLLQSFTSLLSASRFFAVREDVQIEALFEASEKAQNEVTNQLGYQIRQAVELLVNSISRANLERDGKLLAGIAPQRVYEAAVTVMMRLVFLLYAEERELLPLSEPLYAQFYAASTLREQLDKQATLEGDEPLERRSSAWNRLLATFRIIYGGLNHDRLRMIAYGGRLFDPDRFPFLEGRTDKQKWQDSKCNPLPVDDLTVRAIMEAIQTLPIREGGSSERRRLSFRSLDVEQIGHVYEGLLDHGAVQVDDVYVGMVGKTGDEAEIPLSDIEAAARKGKQTVIAFLAEKTKRSESAIENILKDGQSLSQGKDQEMRRLLNTVCDNDTSLAARIAPFVYALRRDLHGLPVLFPSGSLVVKQTRARRDSGTEYTPRELADEMVKYALEPLVYPPGPKDGVEPDQWKLRSSVDLLDLKICDPAVGSGAFLVSACRYLADRIVEAWITEDPHLSKANREDLTLDARRTVVDRCLYGVDRDSMAVEMAKLSLWLTTMHRERPFSFLDHSIREGDSLLGLTSLEQIYNVHINPLAGKSLHSGSLFNATAVVKPLVERATALRLELEALPSVTYRDAEKKQRLNNEASALIETVNVVANSIVAAAFSTATKGDKQRDAAYHDIALHIRLALDPTTLEEKRGAEIEVLRSLSEQRLNADRPDRSVPRVTLHWILAFPEVFDKSAHGFDAIIGNPPFVGGQKITGTFGTAYRAYLLQTVGRGRRGSADLVAYFFLRAAELSSNFAFLAINTISQGDTREVGLDAIISDNWRIVRAVKSRPWPGAAGIHISQVWLSRNPGYQNAVLDNVSVNNAISPLLSISRRMEGNPFRLVKNAGQAMQGSNILGTGFTMSQEEAAALIETHPRNRDVLFPYLNADDLCSRPDANPSRWVINFFDWPLSRANEYPDCLQIVSERVKPEREKNANKSRRETWWRFTRPTMELYAAIADLERVIVFPRVSKVVLPLVYSSRIVFSDRLAVVASDDFTLFAVLSSTVHRDWARRFSGTLETRTNYSPSDCFDTFPFPDGGGNAASIMRRLDKQRREYMVHESISLTSLYNRVHDKSEVSLGIVDIRNAHADLDRDICLMYGWDDLHLDYGFHETDEGTRWTICEATRGEILDRLLEVNRDRHNDEVAKGLVDDTGIMKRVTTSDGKKCKTKPNELQRSLLDSHA